MAGYCDGRRPCHGWRFRVGGSPSTDDSRICVTAARVGVITRSGGLVTSETVPGISFYPLTNRNGMVSNRCGASPGSFLVVP